MDRIHTSNSQDVRTVRHRPPTPPDTPQIVVPPSSTKLAPDGLGEEDGAQPDPGWNCLSEPRLFPSSLDYSASSWPEKAISTHRPFVPSQSYEPTAASQPKVTIIACNVAGVGKPTLRAGQPAWTRPSVRREGLGPRHFFQAPNQFFLDTSSSAQNPWSQLARVLSALCTQSRFG